MVIPKFTVKDIPPQTGRLAAVTGATGGLGYETALALAGAGAEVILLGRNPEKGRVAVEKIRKAAPAAKVRFAEVDLASLASVGAGAEAIVGEGRALDVLINNAGVMALPERRVTVDGFEMQFATNHLSHFLLTAGLMPALRKSAKPRVVNVSSSAARMGSMNFDDLQGVKTYGPARTYAQSKLANLLFTFELQRRSDANGWGLMSNAAHPGYALTELIPNGPGNVGILGKVLEPLFSQSAAAGALPQLYAATSLAAKNAGYYSPDGVFELKGDVKEAFVPKKALDLEAARRLWEMSVGMTGARWPE